MSIKHLVVIDARITDLERLLPSVAPNTISVVLNLAEDGVAQLAAAVQQTITQTLTPTGPGQIGLDSISVVAHGSAGRLLLGNTVLSANALDSYRPEFAAIGAALRPGGDLLLYSCDVAAGDSGLKFITNLAAATGADVAASTNATGANGDWIL